MINRRRQYLFLCLLILPRVSNLFSVKGGCQKRSMRLPYPAPSGAVIEGMGGLSRSGSEEGNSPGERCGEVDAAQLPIPIDVIEWTGTVGRKAHSSPAAHQGAIFTLRLARDTQRGIGLRAKARQGDVGSTQVTDTVGGVVQTMECAFDLLKF